MRTGKEIILATRLFASDCPGKSWAYLLSTGVLLSAALAGTLWNFHWATKIVCSVLAGLLYLRSFVIYHDQQHEAILPQSRLAEAFDEGVWDSDPEPEQCLEKLAQPSSQEQLQASRVSYWFVPDHDQAAVPESLAANAL